MKFSNQALSCVMVALQKCLMEQADIVPILMSFDLEEQKGELFVKNPPTTIIASVQDTKLKEE